MNSMTEQRPESNPITAQVGRVRLSLEIDGQDLSHLTQGYTLLLEDLAFSLACIDDNAKSLRTSGHNPRRHLDTLMGAISQVTSAVMGDVQKPQ